MLNRQRLSKATSPTMAMGLVVVVTVALSMGTYVAVKEQTDKPTDDPQVGITMKKHGLHEVKLKLVSPPQSGTVYIKSPLGTRTELESAGDIREAVAFSNGPTKVFVERGGETFIVASQTIEFGVNPDVTVAKDGSGDYKSLQSALSDVQSGSVIAVKRNHYNSSVTINKSVHIVAETGTVFHPVNSSPAFTIQAKGVTLQNVKVDGKGTGVGIKVARKDAEIAGTRLVHLQTGILVQDSCVAVIGNHITKNYDGIRIAENGKYIQVQRNDLSENKNASIIHDGGSTVNATQDYWDVDNPKSTVYGTNIQVKNPLNEQPDRFTVKRGSALQSINDKDHGHGNECGDDSDEDNSNGGGNGGGNGN